MGYKIPPSITGECGAMERHIKHYVNTNGEYNEPTLKRLEEMADELTEERDRTPDPEVLVGDFFSSCSFSHQAQSERFSNRKVKKKRWRLAI